MNKTEIKNSKLVKNIKKISLFAVQVVKVGFEYIYKKAKEVVSKKFKGIKWNEAFKNILKKIGNSIKTLSNVGKAISILLIVIVVGLFVLHGYFISHFPSNTYINGVEVSDMSLAEARNALAEACNSYQLTLIEKDGKTESIKAPEIKMTINIDDDFDDILKFKSGYFRLFAVLKNTKPDAGDTITYTYDNDLLNKRIAELDCLTKTSSRKPVNAELYYSDGEFKIKPATTGDEVNAELLKNKIENAINNQEAFIDLEVENLYALPEILTDDPGLVAKKESMDKLAGIDIALKFGDTVEKITPETVASWYSSGTDGSLRFEDSKIDEYVSQLAEKYNTISLPKLFVTHYGETIEIGNSYYGWELDNEYASQMLKTYINEKRSISIDLTDRSEESDKWWLKVASGYGELDYYGKTYAEVSIGEQYMWMYMDGEIVFESEVVTGLPDSEHDTPVGIYSIIYKEQNATLRGADYETEVAYWMVFTYDIGFHDADWQSAFGDDIYEYSGSHGCVNLPVDAAGELFDLVYAGMPVFVYY